MSCFCKPSHIGNVRQIPQEVLDDLQINVYEGQDSHPWCVEQR